jgi:hypothetical protein
MPTKNLSLVRLNVRLPDATYAMLKQVAEANAVPMSALIRMLVVAWAKSNPTIIPATAPRP